MSILRLLAAGKSLIGTKSNSSEYRMRTANLIPKFGSSKNPFAQPVPSSSTLAPTAARSTATKMETGSLFVPKSEAPAPAPAPAPVRARALPEKLRHAPRLPIKLETKIPAAPAPAPALAAPRAAVASARKGASWFGWVGKLNPLPQISKLSRPARPVRSRPVQTELSLEKVRVVRNDLSDTDLEILPVKPALTPEAAAPILPPMTGRGPTTWGRLASRFMGAEQTQI